VENTIIVNSRNGFREPSLGIKCGLASIKIIHRRRRCSLAVETGNSTRWKIIAKLGAFSTKSFTNLEVHKSAMLADANCLLPALTVMAWIMTIVRLQ
jgi:hypothetical protein